MRRAGDRGPHGVWVALLEADTTDCPAPRPTTAAHPAQRRRRIDDRRQRLAVHDHAFGRIARGGTASRRRRTPPGSPTWRARGRSPAPGAAAQSSAPTLATGTVHGSSPSSARSAAVNTPSTPGTPRAAARRCVRSPRAHAATARPASKLARIVDVFDERPAAGQETFVLDPPRGLTDERHGRRRSRAAHQTSRQRAGGLAVAAAPERRTRSSRRSRRRAGSGGGRRWAGRRRLRAHARCSRS